MNRKAALFGLFGLLGLLGIPTGNYGLFGFFGFFGFFGLAKQSDERLSANAYRSGFHAFVVALIFLSVLITGISLSVSQGLLAIITAAGFALTILIFVISMVMLEKTGGGL